MFRRTKEKLVVPNKIVKYRKYRKTLMSKDSNLLSGWLLAKGKRKSLKRNKLRLSTVVCKNNVVPMRINFSINAKWEFII